MARPTTDRPTWSEFAEQPAADFALCSPAEELAAVLRRMRADVDRAAEAAARQQVQTLRALAEQAVLALELEQLLDRRGAGLGDAAHAHVRRALGRLKDRMLAQVAAAGLEIVHVGGAPAAAVADLVEIVGWRADDIDAAPTVVTEIDPAVCHNGVALRRGRVIMAGLGDVPAVTGLPVPAHGDREAVGLVAERAGPPAERPPEPRIVCPIAGCHAENPAGADVCIGCLIPLAGFGRLLMHPAALFNRGLRAARAGRSTLARECFSAIVLWLPDDLTTRNAHALACLDAGDLPAARSAWQDVLRCSPGDRIALRGLAAVPPSALSDL